MASMVRSPQTDNDARGLSVATDACRAVHPWHVHNRIEHPSWPR